MSECCIVSQQLEMDLAEEAALATEWVLRELEYVYNGLFNHSDWAVVSTWSGTSRRIALRNDFKWGIYCGKIEEWEYECRV